MNRIEFGDCRDTMRKWASEGVKVQTCVTSPPYFGLRDYGHDGQIGLEQTPEEYIAAMVEVFQCVKDVLADDGTLWLNIGDSYAAQRGGTHMPAQTVAGGIGGKGDDKAFRGMGDEKRGAAHRNASAIGLKHKDLIGIPWMLAFALRADGWYLRQDIIWHKPNPMPESVRDRCTKAHEYIFLLSKSDRYFFDNEALKEPSVTPVDMQIAKRNKAPHKGQRDSGMRETTGGFDKITRVYETRNRRSVWTVATRPYKGAHFATFPTALVEPCILAGSRPNDIVLDPFMGSGTTAQVAIQHGRKYLGCELNPEYGALQQERIAKAMPAIVDDPQMSLTLAE
jgi:DNA modification methylase